MNLPVSTSLLLFWAQTLLTRVLLRLCLMFTTSRWFKRLERTISLRMLLAISLLPLPWLSPSAYWLLKSSRWTCNFAVRTSCLLGRAHKWVTPFMTTFPQISLTSWLHTLQVKLLKRLKLTFGRALTLPLVSLTASKLCWLLMVMLLM